MVIMGVVTSGRAVVRSCPRGAAGLVAPNPFAYNTMVSPAWAAVKVEPEIRPGGPTRETWSEWVAAMYLVPLNRKNEGATGWIGTVTAVLEKLLLVTFI